MNISKFCYFLVFLLTLLSTKESYSQKNLVLDTIINEVKSHSIYKTNVNWNKFIPELYGLVNFTETDSIRRILPAIEKLYTKLGDNHGYFSYKGEITKGHKNSKSINNKDSSIYKYALDERYAFRTHIFENKYGYLAIPSPQISITDIKDKESVREIFSKMAQQIQDSLYSLYSTPLKGIIIDLRLSLGGSYPIVVSSLSPLLENGDIFSIISEGSTLRTVKIQDNCLYDGDELLSITKKNVPLPKVNIVVLLGSSTSSAGEQTAIAFKGINNVKFIGEKTAGLAAMTSLIKFNNDMFFTYSALMLKDRKGNSYETFVSPDWEIKGGDNYENLEYDAKIKSAIKWFKSKKNMNN